MSKPSTSEEVDEVSIEVTEQENLASARNTRSSTNFVNLKSVCLYCDCAKRSMRDRLHSFSTLDIGLSVDASAFKIQDDK